jgi:uncharacterized Zn-binding protein involved in type VI secretion
MTAGVIRLGDTAIGHTNILGATVTGTVVSASDKTFSNNIGVARTGDLVSFPSHPHAIVMGTPTDFRTHLVAIMASSTKHFSDGKAIAKHGDIVPVADIAGPDATLVTTTTKFQIA